MNKQLFDSLDRIDDALLNIDVKVKAIHEKLDELIAALHTYDDGLEMFEDEPKQGACAKHDMASWDEEEQLNKRMDIIGQNGNDGLHYRATEEDESEFDDYGKRIEHPTFEWGDEPEEDYDGQFNDWKNETPEDEDLFEGDEVLSFHSMRLCNEFTISASSFSWWAAFLSGSSQVVYPKPWSQVNLLKWNTELFIPNHFRGLPMKD